MRGDLADPVDAAVLHGGVGVQAAGDGLLDQDLPALAQERDLLLLDPHRLIDLRAFPIQKRRDGALFGEWGERKSRCREVSLRNRVDPSDRAVAIETDAGHIVDDSV